MAESKKVLVAFDAESPSKQSSDFLVPVTDEGSGVQFFGTRSRKTVPLGMVVLTSRSVTENDLFAKLVDAGRKIPNVDESLALLASFLDAMKNVKIGNIVAPGELSDSGFKLRLVANTPMGIKGPQ